MSITKAILGLLTVVVPMLLASCDMVPATPSAPSDINNQPGVTNVSPENLPGARAALTSFFAALNEGRYSDAAALYGGSYETLVVDNPSISRDNQAALLEAGCKVNGFQCLKVKDVIKEEQASPDRSAFVVEFANSDGTVFQQIANGGASGTQQPAQTDFEYSVVKVGDKFLVQDLPVYTP